MTKGSGIRARHQENHPDLFGGVPPLTPKKVRAAKTARTPGPALRSNQSDQPPLDALLNVRQAAARLGLSKSTLDKMRRAHKGPRFVKTTDRAIRYDPVDLDRWINARRSQSE